MSVSAAPNIAFSPYSRGWSLWRSRLMRHLPIFPVFAGMVPVNIATYMHETDFPRIRGDGPVSLTLMAAPTRFSPYSRGWSGYTLELGCTPKNFPRIRGDGPLNRASKCWPKRFSPYSRGWSRRLPSQHLRQVIFPVFAGMVRTRSRLNLPPSDFPRIRGDGPAVHTLVYNPLIFSPY